MRSEREQLLFKTKELAVALQQLEKKIDATQQALMAVRMECAELEKQSELFAQRLADAVVKAELLEQERLALFRDHAELQAQVALELTSDVELHEEDRTS